jgi:hypothetical protein
VPARRKMLLGKWFRSYSIVLVPALFALAGGLSRTIFQLVHSRLQILWLCVAAFVFELISGRIGLRHNCVRLLASICTASIAVIIVKFSVEGITPRVYDLLSLIARKTE